MKGLTLPSWHIGKKLSGKSYQKDRAKGQANISIELVWYEESNMEDKAWIEPSISSLDQWLR